MTVTAALITVASAHEQEKGYIIVAYSYSGILGVNWEELLIHTITWMTHTHHVKQKKKSDTKSLYCMIPFT